MHTEEIQQFFRSPAGSWGPVNLPAAGDPNVGSITQRVLMDALPLLLADEASKDERT